MQLSLPASAWGAQFPILTGCWVPEMAHSFPALHGERLYLAYNEFPPISLSWQGRE